MTFQSMPLHALVVHLPIALTVLVPVVAITALWLGRRTMPAPQAWRFAVAALALQLGSGWLAMQTGEGEEDTVETVLSEGRLHGHEEAADLFLVVSAGVLFVAAGGLLPNRLGRTLRVAGAAGTLVTLAAGWNVGHSGGQLVYRYGAASAYTGPLTGTGN
jgi:uncharacterized membrane protein